MLRKRTDEEDAGQDGARPVMPHADEIGIALTIEEARTLKALADLGAGADYVTPKRVASHMLRRLRERELAVLIDHPLKGTQALLTGAGLRAIPSALKVIAAHGASR